MKITKSKKGLTLGDTVKKSPEELGLPSQEISKGRTYRIIRGTGDTFTLE